MPQFFIKKSDIKGEHVELSQKADIKHLSEVLRSKVGNEVAFIDETETLYTTVIETISKDFLKAKIIKQEKSIRKLNTDIVLIQSIVKSSAQDIAIQKATELGVNEIIPITTDYTVVKLKDEKEKTKKTQRWQKIADESCKQCERSKPPIISEIRTLKNSLDLDFETKIACVERSCETTLKNFLQSNNYKKGTKIAIIIGPEGGWSDGEIQLFTDKKIAKVSLGNMILRAETAAINAISGVIYEYEN